MSEGIQDARFVPGHPMAGSELDGLGGADATMFEGAVWVLTPNSATSDDAFAAVAEMVTGFGAEVVALDPKKHDDLVAVVSHVSLSLLSLALISLTRSGSEPRRKWPRLPPLIPASAASRPQHAFLGRLKTTM